MIDSILLLPFQFGFMQKAFLLAVIIAVPAALLSCFLVIKGWALMGDAISHAVLPGIVIAYGFGLPLILGAFAAGMFCAVATGYITEHSRVKPDTVMGVVFAGMFGLGITLYVAMDTALHLDHVLFGNLLGVDDDMLIMALGLAAMISLGLLMKWKDVLLYCFDEVQARTAGLSVRALHYGLLTALTLMIVATLSATGLILAIGLMIAPGAIAFLLTRRFSTMLILAVGIAVFAMTLGVYASFFLDSAPAPTIIMVFTILFIAAFLWRLYPRSSKTSA